MSGRGERTIPVTLDGLDYEPSSVGGLTYKELITTITVSFIASCVVCVPLAHFIFGIFLLGPIGAGALTILFTYRFSRKAYIWKQGRPSYMLWVEMQKKIQNQGVFGIKVPMGFIKTTYWHTGAKKDER